MIFLFVYNPKKSIQEKDSEENKYINNNSDDNNNNNNNYKRSIDKNKSSNIDLASGNSDYEKIALIQTVVSD